MLVLTRKELESIVIGCPEAPVVLTVLGIRRGVIRLGVEAPRYIPVHRSEVAKALGLGIPHTGTRPPPEVEHGDQ